MATAPMAVPVARPATPTATSEFPGVDGEDGENLLFEDLDDDGDVDVDDFIIYVEDLLARLRSNAWRPRTGRSG